MIRLGQALLALLRRLRGWVRLNRGRLVLKVVALDLAAAVLTFAALWVARAEGWVG